MAVVQARAARSSLSIHSIERSMIRLPPSHFTYPVNILSAFFESDRKMQGYNRANGLKETPPMSPVPRAAPSVLSATRSVKGSSFMSGDERRGRSRVGTIEPPRTKRGIWCSSAGTVIVLPLAAPR